MPFDNEFARSSAAPPILPAVPLSRTDEVLDVLVRARALIACERDWTTRDRGEDGGPCCALGALDRVIGGDPWLYPAGDSDAARYLAQFSHYKLGDHANGFVLDNVPSLVAQHNNSFGHAATLEMFDRAISARRSELSA